MFNFARGSQSSSASLVDTPSLEAANTAVSDPSVYYLNAIRQAVCFIEFELDTTVRDVNEAMANLFGYRVDEVLGQRHRVLCDSRYAESLEYQSLWDSLRQGVPREGVFPRVNKQGTTVWLQATYMPLRDQAGKVASIIKIAHDVTDEHNKHLESDAILKALDAHMALIKFTPDGEILDANDNFCNAMGYRLEEMLGRHHRIFCFDDFYRDNPSFWDDLKQGKQVAGRFQRKNKLGEEVWIEAVYSPVYN